MFADRLASAEVREAAINALKDFFKHADLASVREGGHTFRLFHAGYLGLFQIFPPESDQAKLLSGGGPITNSPPAAQPDAPPGSPAASAAAQNGLPHLTPTDKAVLLSLDAAQPHEPERVIARSGYSSGRVRESLTRMAHNSPPLTIKIGKGYRLTADGAELARKLEGDAAP